MEAAMASLLKQHGLYYLQFYNTRRAPRRKQVPFKTTTKRVAQQCTCRLENEYAQQLWPMAGLYLPRGNVSPAIAAALAFFLVPWGLIYRILASQGRSPVDTQSE
jgi:hypothetical protein